MLILSQIKDNISEIKVHDLELIMSNSFIVFGTIIIVSIAIYGFVDLFFDKSDHDKVLKNLDEKLQLVTSMLEMKGLQTIVTNEEIKYQESKSNEIILILENLSLDIPSIDDSTTEKKKKTYAEEVHENIKNGKQYTYYLKYDNTTHKEIEEHHKAHYSKLKNLINVKEPIFVLIPSNEYNFFSDIYLYRETNGKPTAYEYLPSLRQAGKATLFYLQFDKKQVSKLSHILVGIKRLYSVTLASNLNMHQEFIFSQSSINAIELKSKHIEIITDDLSEDLSNGQFFNAVKLNIKQKKQYIYYVPDNTKINQQILQYKQEHTITDEFRMYVTFIKIPVNSFLFYSNIYIYDKSEAFEFISSTKQYFKYEIHQLNKIQVSLDRLKI